MKKSISVLFCAACMLCLCFLSGCTLTFGNLSSANKVYCQLDGLSSLSFSVRPLSTRETDVIAKFAACVEEEVVKNGTCVFTVSQNICVEVPVEFGAVAEVGDTYVSCSGATAEDICTDCGQSMVPPSAPVEELP